MLTCGNIHGPRNAYKDMLDKVVSHIACVNMKHQNQLEQMANEAMFATETSAAISWNSSAKFSSLIPLTPLWLSNELIYLRFMNYEL
jgi:hypothetical protein